MGAGSGRMVHGPLPLRDALGAPGAYTAADAAREVAAATVDVNATLEEIGRDDEADDAAETTSTGDSTPRTRSHGVESNAEGSPASANPAVVKAVPEHLMDMLDALLVNTDSLEEQITSLSDKLGEQHPSVIKARKQVMLFLKVHAKRKDAEGAWLAYRVLIGHLKTATVKYHRGLKFNKEESAATERARKIREAEGSKYSSSLLSMLQGGTGGGDGGAMDPTDGSALSMLRGNPRPPSKGRDDPDDDED